MAWLLGAYATDAARVGLGAWILALACVPRFRAAVWQGESLELSSRQRVSVLVFAGVALCLLFGHLWAKMLLGEHGIDFAIFSQVIDSIARRGAPLSTLIDVQWRQFLFHHFCPYLYVPGTLVRLGMSAPVAGMAVHVVGAGVAVWALYGIGRTLGVSASVSCVLALLFLLNPTVRTSLHWGFHDEVFALPWLGFAFWCWFKGHFGRTALMLGVCALTKESFFLFVPWFSILAIAGHGLFHPEETRRRAVVALGTVALLCSVAFVGYFFLQPVLFGKPFDHFEKLASLSVLLAPSRLAEKVLWLMSIYVPTLGIPFFSRRGRWVLATSLPFLALVGASSFSEMYKPMNYYAVLPTFIAYVATAVALVDLAPRRFTVPVAVLMCWVGFSYGPVRPVRNILRAMQGPVSDPSALAWIPASARVIVDPAAALGTFHTQNPLRLWTVGGLQPPPAFDFIVTAPKGLEPLTPALESASTPCHSTTGWQVRCPNAESSR